MPDNAFGPGFLDRFREIDNSELLADDALAAGPWEVRETDRGWWGCFAEGASEPELELPNPLQAQLAVLVLPHLARATHYETAESQLLAGRRRPRPGAPALPDRLVFAMGLLLEIATHPQSHAALLELAGPTACQRMGYFLAERVEGRRVGEGVAEAERDGRE